MVVYNSSELWNSKFCFSTLKNTGNKKWISRSIDLKYGKIKASVVKTFYLWMYSHSYFLNWETLNWRSFSSVAHWTEFRWNCPGAEVRDRSWEELSATTKKNERDLEFLRVIQEWELTGLGQTRRKENETSTKMSLKPGEIYFCRLSNAFWNLSAYSLLWSYFLLLHKHPLYVHHDIFYKV